MDIVLPAAVIVVVGLLYKWWAHPHKKYPPGVRGVPILGAIPFLRPYPERTIAKWSREKYGPIMSVRIGQGNNVVISDYDALIEAFVEKQEYFSNRPAAPLFDQVFKQQGIIFRPNNDYYKSQKKFAVRAVSHGVAQSEFESRINEVLQTFTNQLKETNEEPFNIYTALHSAICNMDFYHTIGRTLNFKNKESNSFRLKIRDFFGNEKTLSLLNLVVVIPFLQKIPPFKTPALTLQQTYKDFLEFLEKEITRHKIDFDENHIRDYIDAFLKEQQSGTDGFTNHQLKASIADLWIGSISNTTVFMLWSLLCLIHYPEVQRKLHKEISSFRAAAGKSSITADDRRELHYTMAFIQEVRRFRTAAPLAVRHATQRDVKFRGYVIPKKITVLANLWAIHNDPNLWEKPETFRPERHIDTNGKFVHSKKIILYSVGLRSCPGETYSEKQLFLMLTNLIQNFEILPDPFAPELPDINNGQSGLLFRPRPFKLVVKSR